MYRRNYFPDTHKGWLFQQEQPEFNLSASKLDITFAKYNFTKEDINMVSCDSNEIIGRKALKNHLDNQIRQDIKHEKILEFQNLTKSRVKSKKENLKKSILKNKTQRTKMIMKPPIPRGKNALLGFSQREQKVKAMLEEEERVRKLKEAMKRPEQLINLKNVPTVKIRPLMLELMTKEEENKIISMKVNKNRREEIQIYYEISNVQGRSIPSEKTFFMEENEDEEKSKPVKKLRFNI